MRILVAYDGSPHARLALKYGLAKMKGMAAKLLALHVFHLGMFIDYDALPSAEDLARRESLRHLEDARRIIHEAGEDLRARAVMEEGQPEEEIVRFATAENIDLLIAPPHYMSRIIRILSHISGAPRCTFVSEETIVNGTTAAPAEAAGATGLLLKLQKSS